MNEEANKREYVRVDDQALIKVRTLGEQEYAAIDVEFKSHRMRYSLTTHVCHQRQSREPALRLIRKRNPDIARYLDLLEDQIESLAMQVMKDVDFDENARPQPINLSATGVRFDTPLTVNEGDGLEVGIVLLPDERVVMALGKAVRAVPASNGQGTTVSVHFERVHEEDTEVLIRHVHRVQQLHIQHGR